MPGAHGSVHFPSDTLFSLALGNFIASFVNDAFRGAGPEDTLKLQPLSDGAMLTWQVAPPVPGLAHPLVSRPVRPAFSGPVDKQGAAAWFPGGAAQ